MWHLVVCLPDGMVEKVEKHASWDACGATIIFSAFFCRFRYTGRDSSILSCRCLPDRSPPRSHVSPHPAILRHISCRRERSWFPGRQVSLFSIPRHIRSRRERKMNPHRAAGPDSTRRRISCRREKCRFHFRASLPTSSHRCSVRRWDRCMCQVHVVSRFSNHRCTARRQGSYMFRGRCISRP